MARANFSPHAQQTLALARKEAYALNHRQVGVEHFLLGILKLHRGTALEVLLQTGVNVDELRNAIVNEVGRGGGVPLRGNIPYTPRVKKAIALAGKEARSLGHTYLGSEHLLLGLLREKHGVAARMLGKFGVSYDDARKLIGAAVQRSQTERRATAAPRPSGRSFRIWIDPGEADVQDFKELFSAASDLDRVLGGTGILFSREERQTPIIVALG
jgi:ATP-dependent Clp protease ATP-binding subunit ClpC